MTLLLACNGPSTSTETGNPPVLNGGEVFLNIVMEDQSTIRGEAGAVSPAVGLVTAVDVRTGELYKAPVEGDGSFQISVPGPGLYYVATGEPQSLSEVLRQAQQHPSAVISLGGASLEETAKELGLSCYLQHVQAKEQVDALASAPDRSCRVDADCALVSLDTVCAPSCAEAALSEAAVAEFTAALASVTDRCPDHVSGECSSPAISCEGLRGAIAKCREGICMREDPNLESECGGPAVAVAWRRYANGANPESSTLYTYMGLSYGGISRTDPLGGVCTASLPPCGSEGSDAFLLRSAASHDDVQAALASGGLRVDASAAERVNIAIQTLSHDFRTLDVPRCGDCGVPEGVARLVEVLDEVAGHTTWTACQSTP